MDPTDGQNVSPARSIRCFRVSPDAPVSPGIVTCARSVARMDVSYVFFREVPGLKPMEWSNSDGPDSRLADVFLFYRLLEQARRA